MKYIRHVLGILLCLSTLPFIFTSCDFFPDDPSKPKPGYLDYMPEETSIGANTFGCYINGELAAARGPFQEEGIEPSLWGIGYRYVDGFWWKKGRMQLSVITSISAFDIYIREYPHLGYNIIEFSADKKRSEISFGSSDATIYIIRFDTIEHVISGRFDNIKVPSIPNNLNIKDTLYITDGQFDIKYGTNF